MQKLLITIVIMVLSGCSSYNNAFECKAGKGVNCISVSKINNMVDSGIFSEAEKNSAKNSAKNKIKKETIKVAKAPFPLVLPNDWNHSIVQRIPETTLRIWVAPYVSAQDGYIEAQYVHKVLEKGAWVEQRR